MGAHAAYMLEKQLCDVSHQHTELCLRVCVRVLTVPIQRLWLQTSSHTAHAPYDHPLQIQIHREVTIDGLGHTIHLQQPPLSVYTQNTSVSTRRTTHPNITICITIISLAETIVATVVLVEDAAKAKLLEDTGG